ncbi:MAG: sigma factor-like helix-turn-helix DNA-binding protein [Sedimentisphaerales bacterium]
MRKTLKQIISETIRRSTYTYYKGTGYIFKDYIFGDRYYVTLKDVIYRFLTTTDVECDYEYVIFRNIDIDLLVNELYLHYIRADKNFLKKYAKSSERYKKNYIMKALKNATEPLLKKQLKENEIIFQELNNFKEFHYVSIYAQNLLEDLSYKKWNEEISEKKDTVIKIKLLADIFQILNSLEKKVVYLVVKNKTHPEISKILNIKQGRVRKIIYSATVKLKSRNELKKMSA